MFLAPKRFNIMFWLWIIASLFTAAAADDKNLKHPDDCSMYYSVDFCPPDEHFDAQIGVCTLPQLANCRVTNTETTEPPTPPRTPSGEPAVSFAHPSSCEKYYRLNMCDKDFNFNPDTSACDYPASQGCPDNCQALEQPGDVNMKPPRCATGGNKIGDDCRYDCPRPFQITGTTVLTCTASGWKSDGPYVPPSCVDAVDVIETLLDDLVEELENIDGVVLFVMDESGSVTARNFEKEKEFIQGIIGRLPLSENRSAGVILFSDKPRVEVSSNTKDTCDFFKLVAGMKYNGGGTDIRRALETARDELLARNVYYHKLAIVLLTDGQSPDATDVAQELKDIGAKIFAIGVTGHDEKSMTAMASLNSAGNRKLSYAIGDPRAFDSIVNYLKSEYITKVIDECKNIANNGLNGRLIRSSQ